MLLTLFKTDENIDIPISRSNNINFEKISEKKYLINIIDDNGKDISGILMKESFSTLLVWETYSIETSLKLTSFLECKLGTENMFKPYGFTHDLFVTWFTNSAQVLECSFNSKSGERKLSSFDLKNSKQFRQMLETIKIKFMVFTLSTENIIITAREEGRLSITPDVDLTKLVNILDKLFGNSVLVANV